MAFLHARARTLPGYARIVAAARRGAPLFRLLDVGCGFGQEVRSLVFSMGGV